MPRRHYSRDYLYTKEWRTARKRALKRAGYRCQACGISKKDATLDVDHIIDQRDLPKEDKSTLYDPDNLQILCRACHSKKSAKVRARLAPKPKPPDTLTQAERRFKASVYEHKRNKLQRLAKKRDLW